MKKFIKNLLILIIMTFFCSKGFSQISISYYNSSLSKIGLAYNFSEKLWSELRLYSNTSIDDITPELAFCYNFVHKDKHNIYAGLGGNVNFFTGLVLPVGVQFMPFENFEGFSLHIELQPMFDFETDIILQSSWGLRYKFKK